jgi:hypothetical protein
MIEQEQITRAGPMWYGDVRKNAVSKRTSAATSLPNGFLNMLIISEKKIPIRTIKIDPSVIAVKQLNRFMKL